MPSGTGSGADKHRSRTSCAELESDRQLGASASLGVLNDFQHEISQNDLLLGTARCPRDLIEQISRPRARLG
jgi:hypothetical protein